MNVSKSDNRPAASSVAPVPEHLAGLNPQQREAVEYGIKPGVGPSLVIAGAGSGKTKTLAHRVAHLIINGADPNRILLLTFTRRAAREMKNRVRRVVSGALNGQRLDLSWAGTFHSIGVRLLRKYAQVIGLKPSFTVHDRSDSADLMNLVRHDLEQSKKESRLPQKDTCLAIYSLAINSGSPLKKILSTQFSWCAEWQDELRTLFVAYGKAKQRQNVLDYDDLLLYWAKMLNDQDLAAGRYRPQHPRLSRQV